MKIYICKVTHYNGDGTEAEYVTKVVKTEQSAKNYVEFMTSKKRRPYSIFYEYEEYEVED